MFDYYITQLIYTKIALRIFGSFKDLENSCRHPFVFNTKIWALSWLGKIEFKKLIVTFFFLTG
jgi:hypothetical protein